jgi:hypothetical protein
MSLIGQPIKLPGDGGPRRYVGAFQCVNETCLRLSIGEGYIPSTGTSLADSDDLKWTPVQLDWPEFSDVPDQIARAASEAHACLGFQAYRGAVALARAVVEATAKAKGITSGTLMQKIDNLHAQGHIRDFTKEAAHEVRHGGNEIAHGDLAGEEMPAGDAKAIVRLMDGILREVFQDPAEMHRLRQSRTDREERNRT